MLKPTKAKIIAFLILSAIFVLLMLRYTHSCLGCAIECTDKPIHHVPNIYPDSKCCKVCADTGKFILNYSFMVILYYILPLAILYLIISFIETLLQNRVK